MSNQEDEDDTSTTVHVFGGGTVYHVRPHLALCVTAYGTVARKILMRLLRHHGTLAKLHLTRMAGGGPRNGGMETNEDVAQRIDELIADPKARVIFMTAALCDFEGAPTAAWLKTDVGDFPAGPTTKSGRLPVGSAMKYSPLPAGKDLPRLKTSDGELMLRLTPAEKIIGRIRKERKDIFLVGFKTTAGATPREQYEAGLTLLKTASCNLVLANDVHTRLNMVITPEQARYHETTHREDAINGLVEMAMLRSKLHFTRSTVVDGQPVSWSDDRIPNNLRETVNYCLEKGCYKPFLGSTVGHFAVKLGEGRFLTSRRKTNFNDLRSVGMVLVETDGEDRVVSHGSRPSVGGQSQRIVFAEHPDTDCILHFHGKLRPESKVPVRSQREFECGSHQCGQNTSSGLSKFDVGASQRLYAVILDNHGPNIVFSRSVEPARIKQFLDENFQLGVSTDGFS
jgi:hypothetical protein